MIVTNHIELILIVTGALTASMILMFFAPTLSLRLLFGEAQASNAGIFLARHWGMLVFTCGALIVASAYIPALRAPVLIGSMLQKTVFGVLLLSPPMRGRGMTLLLAGGDLLCVVLYGVYLTGMA